MQPCIHMFKTFNFGLGNPVQCLQKLKRFARNTMLSQVERNFIYQTFKKNRRADGRKNDEFRNVTINFGADYGSALVILGQTKVLAQVSCELGEPKATRPNEGILFMNVELGQMAAPGQMDTNRSSDLNVLLSRTLERTFKESRCVDLESLCVRSEENVWVLRVDLSPLNHDGNLIDCCSIAALAALAHFRRPDVSVIEDEIRIHTAAEKEPIPMLLHHYPVCVTYCTVDDGQIAIADPTFLEERVAESQIIFGLNSFRELCCLNLGGSTFTTPQMIVQCASQGATRAKYLVERIKQELDKDNQAREAGEKISFAASINRGLFLSNVEDSFALRLRHFKLDKALGRKGVKMELKEEESADSDTDSERGATKQMDMHVDWLPADAAKSEDDNDEQSGSETDASTNVK